VEGPLGKKEWLCVSPYAIPKTRYPHAAPPGALIPGIDMPAGVVAADCCENAKKMLGGRIFCLRGKSGLAINECDRC
jgi:hypothetical protein